MDVVGRMLDYYGLSDPVANPNGRGGERRQPLQAAGLIEEADIMDLEKAAKTAPDNLLRRAYANLGRGSRNHLRVTPTSGRV